MSDIEHIKIRIGKKTVNKTYTPFLKIEIDYRNGMRHTKEGYTVGGGGYYKLGASLAKFFNEYLRDELKNVTPENLEKLIKKGAVWSDGSQWNKDNLYVEDLELVGAKVEPSYAYGNKVYDIYFPQSMKGFKTATYGRKEKRDNITQLENSVRRMF